MLSPPADAGIVAEGGGGALIPVKPDVTLFRPFSV